MGNHSPLVSVIIPVFNRDYIITRAVDSVLAQTYDNIEIIVVDDGSTDKTVEVLGKYTSSIKIIKQENLGPSCARNLGIRASTGRYVSFLDSDDEWRPEKIQRQVDVFLKSGDAVSCCLTNAVIHYESGETVLSFDLAPLSFSKSEGIWENPFAVLATRSVFFTQAVMVPRDVLLDVGMFHDDLWLMEDHHLALRLALAGPWGYIRDPLVDYNKDTDSSSLSSLATSRRIFYLENIITLYKDLLKIKNLPQLEKGYFEKQIMSSAHDLTLLQRGSLLARMEWKFRQYRKRFIAALWRRSPMYPSVTESNISSLYPKGG